MRTIAMWVIIAGAFCWEWVIRLSGHYAPTTERHGTPGCCKLP